MHAGPRRARLRGLQRLVKRVHQQTYRCCDCGGLSRAKVTRTLPALVARKATGFGDYLAIRAT